jgi:hypothetical protein
MFKKNIDTAGRVLRLVVGLALLVYAYLYMSWIALILGLFTLFESAMSWCIMYQLLGKSSCPIKKKK